MAETKKSKKKPQGRRTRTIQSLFVMIGIGAGLATLNAITLKNDTATATGPESTAQRQFFVEAADRPDIAVFFKNLNHEQRIQMAKNIGRYDDPKLAKLAAVLLQDFDADARRELTNSLVKLAPKLPKAVAEQMTQKGSFQQVGISTALDAVGDGALPLVVDMLANGDARPFAAAYLTDKGPKTGPLIVPKLNDKDKDIRLAAADAIGKLAYRPAVPPLRALYEGVKSDPTKFDEMMGYLSALSGTGDPSLEKLFTDLLNNPNSPVNSRATAAFGLGRIATPSSVKTVWKYVDSDDAQLASNAIAALQRAGDVALVSAPSVGNGRLRVAAGITGPEADRLLGSALNPSDSVVLSLAGNRPALVPRLAEILETTSGDEQGDVVDLVVRALASTPEGQTELNRGKYSAPVAAIISRRLAKS
jgi:HEAT repeat protein